MNKPKIALLFALPLGLAACAPVVISAKGGGLTIAPVDAPAPKPTFGGGPLTPLPTGLRPSQVPCGFEMSDLVREQYGASGGAYQRVASLCDTNGGQHSSRNMQAVARAASEIEVCNTFVFNEAHNVRGGLRPVLPAYSNARLMSSEHYRGKQFRVETNGQTMYHGLGDGDISLQRVSSPATIAMQGKQPMGAGNYYILNTGKSNFKRGDSVRFCAIYR